MSTGFRNEIWLREQIEIRGRSFSEIAKQFEVDRKQVERFAKKMNIKKPLLPYQNKEWLTEQVMVIKLSSKELSIMCNTSAGTINNWIKQFGIDRFKLLKDKEFLLHHYIELNKSCNEIGEEFGFHKGTVWDWINKHGIYKDKKNVYRIKNLNYENRDWLYEEYVVKDRWMTGIAEECGVHVETISAWIKKFNLVKKDKKKPCDWCETPFLPSITQRNQKFSCCSRECMSRLRETLPSPVHKDKWFHDHDWLYKKYIVEKVSKVNISKEIGVAPNSVRRMLNFFNIEKETGNYENIENRKWLYHHYITLNESKAEIALSQNISVASVGRRLSKFSIKKLDLSYIDFSYQEEEWLRYKIENEKMTPSQVKRYCNLNSFGPIHKYMVKYNIVYTPPRIPQLEDDIWLKHEYIVQNKTINQIANELNVTSTKVISALSFFNIKKHTIFVTDTSYKNESWLREKIEKEGMSLKEVSELCGLRGNGTIHYLCDKYHISAPSSPLEDSDWVYEEYIIKGRQASEIAEELGVVASTVVSWASRHGIRKRGRIELGTYQDEIWLTECAEQGLTKRDVADLESVGYDSIRYFTKKYNISHLFRRETDIERIMRLSLEEADLYFEQEYRIQQFTADFFLPNYKIVVECDGYYWHTQPETVEKDKRRDAFMHDLGYKVLRFWDFEIYENINECVDKINSEINKQKNAISC